MSRPTFCTSVFPNTGCPCIGEHLRNIPNCWRIGHLHTFLHASFHNRRFSSKLLHCGHTRRQMILRSSTWQQDLQKSGKFKLNMESKNHQLNYMRPILNYSFLQYTSIELTMYFIWPASSEFFRAITILCHLLEFKEWYN